MAWEQIGNIRGAPGLPGANGVGAPGKDGVNGEPGLIWRGPWTRNLQYWPDDAVEQDGSSYVCTVATRSKPPSGAWDLLAKRGATGPPGMSRGGGGGGGGGSALTVKDEGTVLDTATASIDFAGAGVTATAAGHSLTVTIPGGGGSQDLEAVLTEGNDGGALGMVNVGEIIGLTDAGFLGGAFSAGDGDAGAQNGGAVTFTAGSSATGNPGGAASLGGGHDDNNAGGSVNFQGGTGNATDADGGFVNIAGGDGNGDGNGGSVTIAAGTAPGGGLHGRIHLISGGTDGASGDVFTAQGNGTALWATVIAALIAGGGQAAFVEPTTATPEAIANSLIAVGLMAAS